LPTESPIFEDTDVALYADERNASELRASLPGAASLASYLRAHFARVKPGDYVALLAYIDRNPGHDAKLQAARDAIRDARHVATVVEFGPRFLHSTGQAYKGGPNSGVFLQVTAQPDIELALPGHRYTFGIVEAAQARGDFEVLARRGRRALRVHLKVNPDRALDSLRDAIIASMR